MNPDWLESLPKTPPETENENLSENEKFNNVLNNIEEEYSYEDESEYEEEEEEEYSYEDDINNDTAYESDNDDINSDDELYDIICMDKSININLTNIEILKFHKNLYKYYDRTRASKELCLNRYNILCLINDIWQKVLIDREFDRHSKNSKNKIKIFAKEMYDINLNYEPIKLADSNEWITPCVSPKKEIKLINLETNKIIYEAIIPSARIFGSICTKLDHFGSDMDITLPNSIDNPFIDIWFNKNEQKSKLSSFLKIFQQLNITKYRNRFKVYPVLNAKVPIIKIKDQMNDIDMDIAIESSQQSVANLINFYCDFDDRVRPFIISIKYWSKIRCLCDATNNYPNSFGFVLLCIKYLQIVNIIPICQIIDKKIKIIHNINCNKFNSDTLLQLLCQFFEMYSRFNFKLLQISTSRIGLESKICHEYYSNFKYNHQITMVIEDPSCRSSNVTRNVRPYRLTIMKNEFFRAYICCKNGDWKFLITKYTTNSNDIPVFNIYPPSDNEQKFYKQKIHSQTSLTESSNIQSNIQSQTTTTTTTTITTTTNNTNQNNKIKYVINNLGFNSPEYKSRGRGKYIKHKTFNHCNTHIIV